MQMDKQTCLILVALSLTIAGASHAAEPLALKAKYTQTNPNVDGVDDDPAWKSAQALSFDTVGVWGPTKGTKAKTTIKAVYTDTHVIFLVVWDDATQDDKFHKPWVWNAPKKIYEQSKEQEDAMALAFEHTGTFTGDMLSPVNAVWDLWTWKATRTNPLGYALDKTHRYSTTKPEGKTKEYPSNAGTPIWIQRPEDAGESIAKSVAAPTTHSGDKLPAYVSKEPSGSAADVRAKGKWENGRWTVELARKLNTGYPDDTVFNLTRSYLMAVALQDRNGDMDKASPVIKLGFDKK